MAGNKGGKSGKGAKAGGTKQLSIASFMFNKPSPKPATPAAPSATEQHASEAATYDASQPASAPTPATAPTSATDCEPPSKRARTQLAATPARGGDTPVATPGAEHSAPSVEPRAAPQPIPPREAPRHERFQKKIGLAGDDWRKRSRAKEAEAKATGKYTPLELQVVDLQRQNPGVLLLVEVGYKFKCFGDDAETAARECNLFCFLDHNFMNVSIPVPRLHVYVRRLVLAGHKVGVVRQVETAALKAASGNRGGPFERKLTAVYTRATLEAGELEDVGGDGGAPSAGSSAASGGAGAGVPGGAQLSAYLMAVVEGEAGPGGKQALGVVAVECSTGDVMYDEFTDGVMREGLEARLLYTAPAELLLMTPLSAASEKLLAAYAGSVPGLRTETAAAAAYSGPGAMAALQAFYGDADREDERGALEALASLPPLVVRALAHAVAHLRPLGVEGVLRLGGHFRRFSDSNEMALSPNAISQLEVLRNTNDQGDKGSLLWLLDRTRTPFGRRLLRHWVSRPLRNRREIEARLEAVAELRQAGLEGEGAAAPLAALPGLLARLPDLERGITRVFHGSASPAEFLAVMRAMQGLAGDLRMQARGMSDMASQWPAG